jgi:hypothetical protein
MARSNSDLGMFPSGRETGASASFEGSPPERKKIGLPIPSAAHPASPPRDREGPVGGIAGRGEDEEMRLDPAGGRGADKFSGMDREGSSATFEVRGGEGGQGGGGCGEGGVRRSPKSVCARGNLNASGG